MKPDTKPGDYYVSIVDGRRTSLALGPFRDDHAAALASVDRVRSYATERFTAAAFWSFGTCRVDHADTNPLGKLNEVIT